VGIECPPEHKNNVHAPSVVTSVSETESNPEIKEVTVITSSPHETPSPPPSPPPLLPVDFIIIFVINGKEITERNIVIDVNQGFTSFNSQLDRLVEDKIPNHLSLYELFGPRVVYKRAYVTKAQALKRKDIAWKEFKDDLDYAGLVNAIRDSKSSKMTLLFRAFITIPDQDFEEQVEPRFASQRVVFFCYITAHSRL
jgi:hypothetical protein